MRVTVPARRAFLAAVFAAPLAVVGLQLGDARASSSYQSPYTYEQTFSSALRLLRVDLGYKITEKDQENGYLMFDYKSPESGSRVTSGSLELVRGKTSVQVMVQLPSMPKYHEDVIVEALAKKLLSDHGDPPKKTPPPAPTGDAGPAPSGSAEAALPAP
jgi:hypothetical protein